MHQGEAFAGMTTLMRSKLDESRYEGNHPLRPPLFARMLGQTSAHVSIDLRFPYLVIIVSCNRRSPGGVYLPFLPLHCPINPREYIQHVWLEAWQQKCVACWSSKPVPERHAEAKDAKESGAISRSTTPIPSRSETPKPPGGPEQFRSGMLTIRIFQGACCYDA